MAVVGSKPGCYDVFCNACSLRSHKGLIKGLTVILIFVLRLTDGQ